jgi:hypothetical protein
MAKRRTITWWVDLFMFLWNTLVAVGFLIFVIKYKLNLTEYFPLPSDYLVFRNIFAFVADKWGVLVLSAIMMLLYLIISLEAKALRRIGEDLFSYQNKPTNWQHVKGRKLFTTMVVLMILVFLGLAWFIDNIAIFCCVFACIPIMASFKIVKLRDGVNGYFSRHQPLDSDRYEPFILERRAVMREYLFDRPQVLAFRLEALACLSASALAVLPHFGISIIHGIPYLILVVTVAVHEYFVWKWRAERDRQLEEIDERQTESDVIYEQRQARA